MIDGVPEAYDIAPVANINIKAGDVPVGRFEFTVQLALIVALLTALLVETAKNCPALTRLPVRSIRAEFAKSLTAVTP